MGDLVGTETSRGDMGMSVVCKDCVTHSPGFCPRCAFLMNNMRRWRRVAEQLHDQQCTHQARQRPSSCCRLLEDMYQAVDMTEIGEL